MGKKLRGITPLFITILLLLLLCVPCFASEPENFDKLLKKVIFTYYPNPESIPSLDEIFPVEGISYESRLIENDPDGVAVPVALNKIIKESLPQDNEELDILIYLIVSLKYPDKRVGEYARERFTELYDKAQKETKLSNLSSPPWTCFYVISKEPESSKKVIGARIKLGDYYLKNEKYQIALKEYQEAFKGAQEESILIEAQEKIADTYLKLGKKEEALETCREIITRYPQSEAVPRWLEKIAGVQYQEKQFQEAFVTLEKVSDSYPDYKLSDPLLSKFFGEEKIRRTKDIDSLKKKIAQEPDGEEGVEALEKLVVLLSGGNEVISLYKELVSKYPGKEIAIYSQVKLAEILLQNGKYEEALAKYVQVIEKYPNSRGSLLAQEETGDYYYEKKEYNLAMERYQHAIGAYSKKEAVLPAGHNRINLISGSTDLTQKELQAKAGYWKAFLNYLTGDYDKALSMYEEVTSNFEKTSEAGRSYFDLAFIYYSQGEYRKASQAGLAAFRFYPELRTDESFLRCIVLLYKIARDTGKALHSYRGRIENDPEDKSRASSVKPGGSISVDMSGLNFEEIIAKYPTRSSPGMNFQALINLIHESVLSSNDEKVISLYKTIATKYPGHSLTQQALLSLAGYLYSTRAYSEAKVIFSKMVALIPEDSLSQEKQADMHHQLGELLSQAGNYYYAVQELKQAAELYPSSHQKAKVHEKIGEISYWETKDYSEALEAYKEITDLTEDKNKKAHYIYWQGMAYNKLGNIEQCEILMRRIIVAYPEWSAVDHAYHGIGVCLFKKREYERAIVAYREFIEKCPKSSLLQLGHLQVGKCLFSVGNYEAAKEEFLNALELNPDNEIGKESDQNIEDIEGFFVRAED